jgi:hypothetical protein
VDREEEHDMLDITCDDCGRVLIGPGRILSISRTDEGLRVAYVCPCGRHGSEITGRRRRAALAPAAPRPLAGATA